MCHVEGCAVTHGFKVHALCVLCLVLNAVTGCAVTHAVPKLGTRSTLKMSLHPEPLLHPCHRNMLAQSRFLTMCEAAPTSESLHLGAQPLCVTRTSCPQVIQKMSKQRRDSIDSYKAGGREDLVGKVRARITQIVLCQNHPVGHFQRGRT